MDILSVIGYILAVACIVFGVIYVNGTGIVLAQAKFFLDIPSIIITIGGTIAVMLISFPVRYFANIPKHLKIIFAPEKYEPQEYITLIGEFAKEARIRGLLSLENKLADVKNDFLKRSLMLVVDSVDAEKVHTILETELNYIEERHYDAISFYNRGASFAPAFGMIGTLIGLVIMLNQMESPDSIGASMGVAILTTLYGSILANVLFAPIAAKLKIRHDEEMLCKTVIAEGVRAIQAGENPRFIEEKLQLLLESKKRGLSTSEEGEGAGAGGRKKGKKAK